MKMDGEAGRSRSKKTERRASFNNKDNGADNQQSSYFASHQSAAS